MQDGAVVTGRGWPASVRPRGWWFDLLVLAGFVALTVALDRGHLLTLDERVAEWSGDHRPTPVYVLLRVLNYLGQGGQVLMPITIVLTALVARRRRSVRPLLVFAAVFVLTYLTIGPLKIWLDRAAPGFDGPDRLVLFNPHASGALAMSYPSGHVANAVVWYGVITVLLNALLRAHERPVLRARSYAALRALPPAVVFCTTTWLSYHWITDSVAGLLLGLMLTRLLARIPWDTIPLPRLPRGVDRPAGL